jgi:hypothetical protein
MKNAERDKLIPVPKTLFTGLAWVAVLYAIVGGTVALLWYVHKHIH